MFSIGDHVVYGSTGICEIMDIGVPDVPGAEKTCYQLRPLYAVNSKVYAPVDGSLIPMRSALTVVQVKELIDSLPTIEPFPEQEDRQKIQNAYKDAIKSADSRTLASLIRTLYEKRVRLVEMRKAVPATEKEYFDAAERVLYGEIAAALKIPVNDVQEYIDDRLEAAAGE